MIVNKNKGFTLIEILLAMAILGIGLVGILGVFTVGTNSVRRTIDLTNASFIMQMVFEDFKRQGHTNPASLTVPETYITNYYEGYRVGTPGITSIGNNLYKVDLDVYKGSSNKPLIQFTTYITKYEP